MTTSYENNLNNEIYFYVLKNDINNVKKLLKKGAFLGSTIIQQTGLSLIGQAAKQGSTDLLQILLESCYDNSENDEDESEIFNINVQDKKTTTPDEMNELLWDYEIEIPTITEVADDEWTQLFLYYGKVIEKTHEYLITTKQDPHALDRHFLSPLHYAAINGHIDCVQLLIDFGCSVNIETHYGYTALHLGGEHKQVIELLLQNKANPNKITYEKLETPLMLATKKGDTVWMKLLIENGANVNAINYLEQSALTLGVINNQYDAVRLLILNKARINELDFDGLSPIHYALEHKHKEIIQLLLDNGARIHPISSLLQSCLKQNNCDIAKILIDAGINVNFRLNGKETPLHAAILNCDANIVEYMIKNGAKLGFEYEYDHKEIHLLMKRKCDKITLLKILNILFECGVDLNEESGYKKTPLEVALLTKNFISASIIIKQGANVNRGCLAASFEYLKSINFIEFIKLLVYAGYKIRKFKKYDILPTSLTDSSANELQYLYTNPLTLKQQSRITIRNILIETIKKDQKRRRLIRPNYTTNNSFLESYADNINLPISLKSYICEFTDIDLDIDINNSRSLNLMVR